MKLTVDISQQTEPLGDLYGIFFEDLNHAADGGLYAEMVQNRSFEFAAIDNPDYHGLTAWESVERDGQVRLALETGNAVSGKNPHYLGMDILTPGTDVGVQNVGFGSGMSFTEGAGYRFCCYAKREQDFEGPLTVSLRGKNGEIYAASDFTVSDVWEKYELELVAEKTDSSGRLAVTAAGRGKVYLDFVSLFPKDTYKGRKNGMRRDLAELLEAMHPKFMRFPGGCLTHDGALDPDARDAMYRWKNTLGPVEHRPARRSNWGYNQTLGLGFYEYFQFCEDIGAKPLPVISPGYDPHHKRAADLTKMQPWIAEALDLIEFANGSPDTGWGAVRAQMGHEEPFGMEYLGIGNEEVGEAFYERFDIVYRAVREKHPEIKVIGTSGPFCAGSEYERGWASARKNKVDFVDEHYYMSPEWFLANCHRYDTFSKEDPKVFLGEYASWGNTWYNALAESAFMICLEKNAHAVGLACYAPMLCHADYVNWKPDMIWFDNHRSYGTANYYIQKMFMHHQGETGLFSGLSCESHAEDCTAEIRTAEPDQIPGVLVLENNDSAVEYRDITLTDDETGEVTHFADCCVDGEQSAVELGQFSLSCHTLRMKAAEREGYKGFRIYFGKKDDRNTFCWEIGGWQNQDTVINERIDGRGSDLCQALFTVEKNRVYELELKIRGRHLTARVDGIVYLETKSKPVIVEPLYTTASRDGNGDVIIKVSNVSMQARKLEVVLQNPEADFGDGSWELYVETLGGFAMEDQNSFEEPEKVKPVAQVLPLAQILEGTKGEPQIPWMVPAESFTVLRIRRNGKA